MMPPFLVETLRPTDAEIASAYLRIAHIYRRGGLHTLAIEYYRLVTLRFAAQAGIACPARRFLARSLATIGEHAAASDEWQTLVDNRAARPALACRAALELLRLGAMQAQPGLTGRLRWSLGRRLQAVLGPHRFRRWQRLAARVLASPTATREARQASG